VDMWAAGLILAEMSAGGPLFVVDSEIDLLFSIFRMLGTPNEKTWPGVQNLACSIEDFPRWPAKENLEEMFSVLGSKGCDLLSKMLRYDASSRISALEALRHPFFTDYGLPPFVFDSTHASTVPPALQNALCEGQCAIWSTLLQKQADMPATRDYLATRQPQEKPDEKLTERMRAILVDWLAEVSYSWCLRAERRALHAAVHCLDRFLSQKPVPKTKLQLVGATCYALTAKLEEAEVISPSGYAHISDFAFKEEEMRECEVEIAHVLGCRFVYAAVPDFEPLLATAMGLTPDGPISADAEIPRALLVAQMLGDFMLLGFHVGKKSWCPSIVASAAFAVACVALNVEVPEVLLCNADEDTMCRCVDQMLQAYNQGIEWDLRNLCNNPKYQPVVNIEMPHASFACSKISEAYKLL